MSGRRADMTDRTLIVARMVRDLRSAAARSGWVDLFDLAAAGWTDEQIAAHGLAAVRVATAPALLFPETCRDRHAATRC